MTDKENISTIMDKFVENSRNIYIYEEILHSLPTASDNYSDIKDKLDELKGENNSLFNDIKAYYDEDESLYYAFIKLSWDINKWKSEMKFS